ncbi:MAG: hypothetical protein ABIH92_00300 [Nanoarchaeota archaeon]
MKGEFHARDVSDSAGLRKDGSVGLGDSDGLSDSAGLRKDGSVGLVGKRKKKAKKGGKKRKS